MDKEKKKTASGKMKDLNADIATLIAKLGSRDGRVRGAVREKLVLMGRPAVGHLAKLIGHPRDILRWECVKTLSEIADPDSTPLLIHSMSDANEEVRWLAAEGLIAIGSKAVRPVLEELVRDPSSLWIQRGVHHYLTGLSAHNHFTLFNELIRALDLENVELHAPAIAYKILRKMRRIRAGKNFLLPNRSVDHRFTSALQERKIDSSKSYGKPRKRKAVSFITKLDW